MNMEDLGIKKTLEILNSGGPMVPSRIDADEQLICWACSQAIIQASMGNKETAKLIIDSVSKAMNLEEFLEDCNEVNLPEWMKKDYNHAVEHVSSRMQTLFFGMGGTANSISDVVGY